MYDIITTSTQDSTIMAAINTVARGSAPMIPSPQGNYVLTLPSSAFVEGNGGTNHELLVVVDEGSPTGLGGAATWSGYAQPFPGSAIDWSGKTAVYVVACSAPADAQGVLAFLSGSFARELRESCPRATLWGCAAQVEAGSLTGNWERIG